jgi:hypothetical protein
MFEKKSGVNVFDGGNRDERQWLVFILHFTTDELCIQNIIYRCVKSQDQRNL